MLADAGGEDERVEALRGHRHRRHGGRDSVRVDAQRELGVAAAEALELVDVAGAAREAEQARLVLEHPVELVDGQAPRA